MKIFSLIRRALFPVPATTQVTPTMTMPATLDKKTCWKIAGHSAPGTAHLRRGRTCEDNCDWFMEDELLGIAVADGAGSASHGAIGSALVVRTALKTLLDLHLKVCPITAKTSALALGLACQKVQNSLAVKAIELGIEPSDLATTLIIVVASRSFVATAHVGDGAVVVSDQDGKLTTLTTPTNGEFANETVLLGCRSTIDFKIKTLAKFRLKSLAVFSDGLQRLALKMPQGIPHAPFFRPIFNRLQSQTGSEIDQFLKAFLNSTAVNNRTDDDKSLVIAHVL